MVLVAFLLLVVLGREAMGSRTFVQAKGNIDKRSAAVIDDNSKKKKKTDGCRSSKLIEKNCATALDDDKRVVPTGPNPLHNR